MVAALGIPVGRVLTSPLCRAADTAKLAFGAYEKSDALMYALRLSPEQRREVSARLRDLLATPPAPGTNTVLVAHNANLKEAVGLWPKAEADAHVVPSAREGGFERESAPLVRLAAESAMTPP